MTHLIWRRGVPDYLYGGPGVVPSIIAPPAGRCATLRLAEEKSGVPLAHEEESIKFGRDHYLTQTAIGRFATAVFYKNEIRLRERGEKVELTDEEKAFAQSLYSKYAGDAKLVLANPNREDLRLTPQHLIDAEAAFAASRRFLREDELEAADRLAEIARSKAKVGMTAREGLEILDDENLLQQVKEIAATVKFLDTNV